MKSPKKKMRSVRGWAIVDGENENPGINVGLLGDFPHVHLKKEDAERMMKKAKLHLYGWRIARVEIREVTKRKK